MALARVVFTSREHVIALEPRGKGLLGVTLRYPYEVRKEDEYFADIEDEKIPKDMMELASHIVETKSGHFKPEEFEDHYEDALKELLKKKLALPAPTATTLCVHASAKRGTASSTTSHAEESRPVICGAEEGRLILAPGEPSKILGRCCAGALTLPRLWEGHPEQRTATICHRGWHECARQPRAQLSASVEHSAQPRIS